MVGVMTLHRTTIGKKVIMAVTGLIGIGFVLGHMYGNLKVFFGAEEFDAYAEGLRALGSPIFTHSEPLWLIRLVLLAAVALHVWSAWSLYQESRQARATKYAVQTTLETTWAARYIRVGGTVIGYGAAALSPYRGDPRLGECLGPVGSGRRQPGARAQGASR